MTRGAAPAPTTRAQQHSEDQQTTAQHERDDHDGVVGGSRVALVERGRVGAADEAPGRGPRRGPPRSARDPVGRGRVPGSGPSRRRLGEAVVGAPGLPTAHAVEAARPPRRLGPRRRRRARRSAARSPAGKCRREHLLRRDGFELRRNCSVCDSPIGVPSAGRRRAGPRTAAATRDDPGGAPRDSAGARGPRSPVARSASSLPSRGTNGQKSPRPQTGARPAAPRARSSDRDVTIADRAGDAERGWPQRPRAEAAAAPGRRSRRWRRSAGTARSSATAHRVVPALRAAQLLAVAGDEQQRVVGAGAEDEHRRDAADPVDREPEHVGADGQQLRRHLVGDPDHGQRHEPEHGLR